VIGSTRCASRMTSHSISPGFSHQASVDRSESLPCGQSLAAETSARPFLWIQRLASRFLESVDAARKSACATSRTHFDRCASLVINQQDMVQGALERQVMRKLAWPLLPFMGICYVAALLDRVNVSFAKLSMLADLNFSTATYATGAGIFFVGYFIFEVPSNLLLERVGARIWIARIMLL
jgi:hypothetical protein